MQFDPPYDLAVFIGRFQPFHIGHMTVAKTLYRLAHRALFLVGSAGVPRNIKNPWTFEERAAMIRSSTHTLTGSEFMIDIEPLPDDTYNDQRWAESVQAKVEQALLSQGWSDMPRKVVMVGHTKDESSYYLKMFPQWDLEDHELDEQVDATDIRGLYFEGKSGRYLRGVLTPETQVFLDTFSRTPEYQQLCDEHEFIQKYRKSWAGTPWPVIFVTVDAVVVQSGHVLLVKRRESPGKGLWALPGGFLNPEETCETGMLRELREETKIDCPEKVLRGSIKAARLFDSPGRSLRGRTVTQAHLIELPPGPLPKVKGGDDAVNARWFPLNDVKPDMLFEDHFHIIQRLIGEA